MKNLENFGVLEMSHYETQEVHGGIIFTVMLAFGVGAAAYGIYEWATK
ncbi:hypothetical protein MHTCC0001_16580 [Flavobacteriaceae bacterium MHTCC 0001]